MNNLARALGWSPETLDRASQALADERRHRQLAHRALRPHLAVAHANYLIEQARLKAEIRYSNQVQ